MIAASPLELHANASHAATCGDVLEDQPLHFDAGFDRVPALDPGQVVAHHDRFVADRINEPNVD
jgi:hypothetical protein